APPVAGRPMGLIAGRDDAGRAAAPELIEQGLLAGVLVADRVGIHLATITLVVGVDLLASADRFLDYLDGTAGHRTPPNFRRYGRRDDNPGPPPCSCAQRSVPSHPGSSRRIRPESSRRRIPHFL